MCLTRLFFSPLEGVALGSVTLSTHPPFLQIKEWSSPERNLLSANKSSVFFFFCCCCSSFLLKQNILFFSLRRSLTVNGGVPVFERHFCCEWMNAWAAGVLTLAQRALQNKAPRWCSLLRPSPTPTPAPHRRGSKSRSVKMCLIGF